MAGLHLVAVHELTAEVAINLVEVQAVVASEQALGEGHVRTYLFYVAGASRIIARGLNAAAQGFVALETHHIVGLPAVQADRGLLQLCDGLVGIDAEGGIALAGDFIGFQNQIFFHECMSL